MVLSEEYKQIFFDEARIHLQNLLLKLPPSSEEILKDALRSAHTLKGICATVGFEDLVAIFHQLESLIEHDYSWQDPIINHIQVIFDILAHQGETPAYQELAQDILSQIQDKLSSCQKQNTQQSSRPLADVMESLKNIDELVEVKEISQEKKNWQESLPDNVIQQWKADKLKIFKIELALADYSGRPARQFLDLLEDLKEYLGQILRISPDLEELKHRAWQEEQTRHIDEILAQKTQRVLDDYRLDLLLAVRGDSKSILQFLRDACELKSADITELKLAKSIATENSQGSTVLPSSTTQLNGSLSLNSQHKTTFIRANANTIQKMIYSIIEMTTHCDHLCSKLTEQFSNYEVNRTLQQMQQTLHQLQGMSMDIQMMQVGQIFNRFRFFVEREASALEKDVILEISGQEVEIDRLLVDDLSEILTHLIRNSLDHGIETTEQRQDQGKSSQGLLQLKAISQAGRVCLSIQDDGCGLNIDKIIEKSQALSLETSHLSPKEIQNLIFQPGFSTKDNLQQLSGRGIGLDIVQSKVRNLGGDLKVKSLANKGTTFELEIPVKFSIIEVLILSQRGQLCAIGTAQIKEIIKLEREQIKDLLGQKSIDWHGQMIPLIDLNRLLWQTNRSIPKQIEALVMEINGVTYGLLIEKLIEQQRIVVSPLKTQVSVSPFIRGTSIFHNGQLVMLLKLEELLSQEDC